jgi:pentatricopeptide repeat protein
MPRVRLSSASSSISSSTEHWISDALIVATERLRSGTFSPGDAHHLFDELLHQGTPVPERPLDGFLAVLARAPASDACSDGPALAIDLFCRMNRGAGPQVFRPTRYTYDIFMDCCCRTRRLDLTLAAFGRLPRTGIGVNVVAFSSLPRGLCHAKRTEEAMCVLLNRMPKLGCVPDVFSYTIVLKGLCGNGRSQRALEILCTMGKGGACLPARYCCIHHGHLRFL